SNERINRRRTELRREIKETEKKLEQVKKSHIDPTRVEELCGVVSQNLSDFGDTEKKLALEVFKIKVWIDGKSVILDGVFPTPSEACAMSQHS
ncbi:unnamed protein product, partial [marine sediment metagenome]